MSKKDGLERGNETKKISRSELLNNSLESYTVDTKLPTGEADTNFKPVKLLMWLIISSPETHRGTVLPIAEGTVIGRHGDIPWEDPRISRRHARFTRIDNPDNRGPKIFAITPEKDRNGTIVNGRRITETTPLRENDAIIMGNTRFIVKVLE